MRLLRAISNSDRALDDDELSQRTGIKPRQTVNQILRRLEREGVVRRRTGPEGKLVTELPDGIGRPRQLPGTTRQPTAHTPSRPTRCSTGWLGMYNLLGVRPNSDRPSG